MPPSAQLDELEAALLSGETTPDVELFALDRAHCAKSLHNYVQLAWHIVEPGRVFQDNWHIQRICEAVQAVFAGEIQNLVINMPPRHAKSLTVSVFAPSWWWTKHPHERFLYSSYAERLSIRDSIKTRRVIESPWYQQRWGCPNCGHDEHDPACPAVFHLTSDQNQKIKFENNRLGYRLATSVGGSNTGEGGDIIVVDDPHNVEEAESDIVREGVIDWWKEVMSTRVNDPKKVRRIIIMQRVHEGDLSNHLISSGDWVHLNLPARYESGRCVVEVPHTHYGQDPRTTDGELLWPDRYGEPELSALEKELDVYGTSAQLQQRPSPEEGGILKRHWWRYWHHPDKPLPPVRIKDGTGEYVEIPAVPLPYVFDQHAHSWDMTFKDIIGTDFVVGQPWAKRQADAFLLAQLRGRMDFPTTLDAVKQLHEQHPQPGARLIEDKANGPAVISMLRREIPGILPVNPEGSKVARASAYAYLVRAGNVFLPHPAICPWVSKFIDECANFPNGIHDDQVDAWSQAMDELYKADQPGLPITPEYKTRFHQAPVDNDPTPGRPSFRFWHDDGVHQVCVIGQQLLDGQIRFLDSIVMKQSSIEALIERKLLPLLNEDYRGVSEWRDIGPFAPLTKLSPSSEHSMAALIHEKLNGALEAGEPDFLKRVSAIKSMLLQTGRMQLNRMPTLNEPKNWTHEALNGGYAFHIDKSGVVQRTEGRKFHALTAVGDALGHGLHVIFQRKPTPAQRVPKAEQTRRAKSYAV